jgi:hypothetical protein
MIGADFANDHRQASDFHTTLQAMLNNDFERAKVFVLEAATVARNSTLNNQIANAAANARETGLQQENQRPPIVVDNVVPPTSKASNIPLNYFKGTPSTATWLSAPLYEADRDRKSKGPYNAFIVEAAPTYDPVDEGQQERDRKASVEKRIRAGYHPPKPRSSVEGQAIAPDDNVVTVINKSRVVTSGRINALENRATKSAPSRPKSKVPVGGRADSPLRSTSARTSARDSATTHSQGCEFHFGTLAPHLGGDGRQIGPARSEPRIEVPSRPSRWHDDPKTAPYPQSSGSWEHSDAGYGNVGPGRWNAMPPQATPWRRARPKEVEKFKQGEAPFTSSDNAEAWSHWRPQDHKSSGSDGR